jgi:hypothetical protein
VEGNLATTVIVPVTARKSVSIVIIGAFVMLAVQSLAILVTGILRRSLAGRFPRLVPADSDTKVLRVDIYVLIEPCSLDRTIIVEKN